MCVAGLVTGLSICVCVCVAGHELECVGVWLVTCLSVCVWLVMLECVCVASHVWVWLVMCLSVCVGHVLVWGEGGGGAGHVWLQIFQISWHLCTALVGVLVISCHILHQML